MFGATPERCRSIVEEMFDQRMVFMLELGGRVIGSAGLEFREVWWSNDGGHYTNRWIYILPEFRSLNAAMSLSSLLSEIAKHNGKPFYLSVFTQEGRRVIRLDRRMRDEVIAYYDLSQTVGEFRPKE